MSAIGGAGGCSSAGSMSGMQRPDSSKMVDNLFSKLDTKGQGYIEKSDFQGAFDKVASKSASADDVFKALDGNDDGKITKQEMSDSVTKLADQLVSQLQNMRMSGMGGVGMSKSDISSMADSSGSASQQLNELAQNFDVADTNQDGTISAQELMAYQASNSATSSTSGVQNGDAQVMARIMDMMTTYGATAQDEQTSGGTISTAV
ncbi:MAG: EF-hand domain-containing protein [Gallionella sp.]|nr:EF-hand domain-containing protein [Gallionella sp.]MDP1594131.1 EF-hand domain-containing protein [Gallionella sp.]MDP1941139.1 EF-hand domain-containing protein [Gallionella sp.]